MIFLFFKDVFGEILISYVEKSRVSFVIDIDNTYI